MGIRPGELEVVSIRGLIPGARSSKGITTQGIVGEPSHLEGGRCAD